MAHVHFVKKARKANKALGIKKGESYYWWKFRRGGKRVSKTPPKRSQTTQSAYYAAIYDIEDDISAVCNPKDGSKPTLEELKSCAENASEQLNNLESECQEKRDNMPEALQEAPTGELLQERVDACNSATQEFDNFDVEDKEDSQSDEEYLEAKIEELSQIEMPQT